LIRAGLTRLGYWGGIPFGGLSVPFEFTASIIGGIRVHVDTSGVTYLDVQILGSETVDNALEIELESFNATSGTNSGGTGNAVWGGIAGTLALQTDLISALNGKESADAAIQSHITGTGSPHTAAGVGAETAGAVSTHDGLAAPHSAATSVGGKTIPTGGIADAATLGTHVGLTTTAHGGVLASTAFSGLAKITVAGSAPGSPDTGDLWIST